MSGKTCIEQCIAEWLEACDGDSNDDEHQAALYCVSHLEELYPKARAVVDSWEHGDLAAAVRALDACVNASPDDEAVPYTVVGLWINGTPIPAGVIEGAHGCVDQGPNRWATDVLAPDPAAAEAAAVREMTEAHV